MARSEPLSAGAPRAYPDGAPGAAVREAVARLHAAHPDWNPSEVARALNDEGVEISRQRVSEIARADGWREKRGRASSNGTHHPPAPLTALEIRAFRGDATQADTAARIGVTEDTWRRWERGTQPAPAMLRLVLEAAGAKPPKALPGSDIRTWREQHGDLTQAALAALVGVRKDTIACWERGDTKPPAMLRLALKALAAA